MGPSTPAQPPMPPGRRRPTSPPVVATRWRCRTARALTGTICPTNGDASGFSTSSISQADELSGGQTQTEVPDIENTSPMQGESVYGFFVALAESGLPGPHNTVIPTDASSKIAQSIAPPSLA